MAASAANRITLVWLGLSAITLLSWWIGAKHGAEVFARSGIVTFSVILLAAIKIRFILREFMEVRSGPVLLKRLTDGVVVVMAGGLLAVYASGVGIHLG
jgi:Prokaryotic Cytochrome C oxidase subunit IV